MQSYLMYRQDESDIHKYLCQYIQTYEKKKYHENFTPLQFHPYD